MRPHFPSPFRTPAPEPYRGRGRRVASSPAFRRETFTLPRQAARTKAREFLELFPPAAYMSAVESWRELADGRIEFTMRRLPTAD